MSQTTQELVAAVQAETAQYSSHEQSPLAAEKAETFKKRVAETFNYVLPQEYVAILRMADGIDWNSFVLYSSEIKYEGDEFILNGFIEANTLLRGPAGDCAGLGDLMSFAESGIDLYQHNRDTGQFQLADRTSGWINETFESAQEMFQQLLRNMVNYGVGDEQVNF